MVQFYPALTGQAAPVGGSYPALRDFVLAHRQQITEIVATRLGFKHQRATGDRTESAHGDTVLNAVTGQGPQQDAVELLVGGAVAQLLAQTLRGLTISALS